MTAGYSSRGGISAWSDDFNRANTARGAGDRWVILDGNPFNAADSKILIQGNRLQAQNTTGSGANVAALALPSGGRLVIRSQSVEGVLAAQAGDARLGPGLLLSGSAVEASNGYYLSFNPAGALRLTQWTSPGETDIGLIGTYVPGDSFKMIVSVLASKNTIKSWKNGVLINTTDDASVGRPQYGLAGFAAGFIANGATIDWDSFKCMTT